MPASPSAWAIPRPTPRLAPVTNATCGLSLCMLTSQWWPGSVDPGCVRYGHGYGWPPGNRRSWPGQGWHRRRDRCGPSSRRRCCRWRTAPGSARHPVQHLGVRIGEQTALGADVAGIHPHGVERPLGQWCKAWVPARPSRHGSANGAAAGRGIVFGMERFEVTDALMAE